ncbi:hypothetical protein ACLOJK_036934 [Asimina triloba]
MDQRQGNTDRFLLRPHLAFHFSQMHLHHFLDRSVRSSRHHALLAQANAHMHAPCNCHLQHVVNFGNAVDDRRFALKAAAKATVPAATVPNQIFYK